MTTATVAKETRRLFKANGSRWCEVEVSLKDGRLSICGSEGSIISPVEARQAARDYWEGYFEECPEEIKRLGRRSARGAAEYVLRVDGQYHGLDLHPGVPADGKVYITESCGQIRETIAQWFPEVAPYLQYHLNDMHAECEHQEARGETWSTHPSAVCPDCGYKLGSAWLKRELPPAVVAWFENLSEVA